MAINELNFGGSEAFIKKIKDTDPEIFNALFALLGNLKTIRAILVQDEGLLNRRDTPTLLERQVRPVSTLPPPLAHPGEGLTFFDSNRKRFRKSFDTYAYYDYPTPEGCRVYNDAIIVIADVTVTALTFNQERFDPFAMHSTSANTSRITIPISGRYAFGGHVRWDTNTTGIRLLFIRVNGATVIASNVLSAGSGGVFGTDDSITTMYEMAKDDYVELCVYQNSGANRDLTATGNFSPEFWAHRLG